MLRMRATEDAGGGGPGPSDRLKHGAAAVTAGDVCRIRHPGDRRVGSAVGALRPQLEAAQAVDAPVATRQVRAAQPWLPAGGALGTGLDLRIRRHWLTGYGSRSAEAAAPAAPQPRVSRHRPAARRLNLEQLERPVARAEDERRVAGLECARRDVVDPRGEPRAAHAEPLAVAQLEVRADVRRQRAHAPLEL